MKEAPKEVGEVMCRKYSKHKKATADSKKGDQESAILGKRKRKPRVRLGEEPSEPVASGAEEEANKDNQEPKDPAQKELAKVKSKAPATPHTSASKNPRHSKRARQDIEPPPEEPLTPKLE